MNICCTDWYTSQICRSSLGAISIFPTFKEFNIKASRLHHPVIQKEVDEQLAKGALNHLLVVLVFTQVCLWFLSIPVVYDL